MTLAPHLLPPAARERRRAVIIAHFLHDEQFFRCLGEKRFGEIREAFRRTADELAKISIDEFEDTTQEAADQDGLLDENSGTQQIAARIFARAVLAADARRH